MESFTHSGALLPQDPPRPAGPGRVGTERTLRLAPNSLPLSVTAPGYSLARGFSAYGEFGATTMTVAGTDAYGYSLSRDNAGRIASRTERIAGQSRTLDYAYDPLGRLTTVTAGGETIEAYHYDANGNRTHAFVPARGVDATTTFDTAYLIATGS